MSDNGEAAANLNRSWGGLRDLLFNFAVQKPQILQQRALGQQAVEKGANDLSLSNLETKKTLNMAAAAPFQPNLDEGHVDAPSFVPTKMPAATSALIGNIVGAPAALPDGTPVPDPGATTSATPPPKPSQQYGSSFFSDLPGHLQSKVINQYKAAVPHPELLRPEEIAQMYNTRLQTTQLPPVNPYTIHRFGLGVTTAKSGPEGTTFDYASNPGRAISITAPGGGPSGKIMVNGVVSDDPSFVKPEQVQEGEGNLAVLNSAADQVAHVQSLIKATPSLVGPLGGNAASRFVSGVAPLAVGNTKRFSANDELEQFVNGSVFKALGSVKLARATEKEIGMLQSTLPKLTSTPDVWQRWFDRFNSVLDTERAAQARVISPYQQQLPAVNPGAAVQPISPGTTGVQDGTTPGSTAGGTRTIWPGQENSTSPGEEVIWGPTGQRIRR